MTRKQSTQKDLPRCFHRRARTIRNHHDTHSRAICAPPTIIYRYRIDLIFVVVHRAILPVEKKSKKKKKKNESSCVFACVWEFSRTVSLNISAPSAAPFMPRVDWSRVALGRCQSVFGQVAAKCLYTCASVHRKHTRRKRTYTRGYVLHARVSPAQSDYVSGVPSPLKSIYRAEASTNVASTKFEKNPEEGELTPCVLYSYRSRIGRFLPIGVKQRLARRDAPVSRGRERERERRAHGSYSLLHSRPQSSLVYRVDARFFQICINEREIKRLDPRGA